MFGRITQEKTGLHTTTLPSLLSETVVTDVRPRIWRGHRRPIAVEVNASRDNSSETLRYRLPLSNALNAAECVPCVDRALVVLEIKLSVLAVTEALLAV